MSDTSPPKRAKMAASLSDAQIAAVKALQLQDAEGDDVTVQTVEPLDPERHTIYAEGCPDVPPVDDDTRAVASVHCTNDNGTMEHIVVVSKSEPISAEAIIYEDKIMYDEVPLSGIVEYRFSPDKPWMLGSISEESLDIYKNSKFQLWKEMLMTGGAGCMRTFKSMLRTGLVTRIYDHVSFPSPKDEASNWEVVDENTGKPVAIPRPVAEIRLWNPEEKAYESVSTRMDGAPAEEEEKTYWENTLKELRELHGADIVDKLLA